MADGDSQFRDFKVKSEGTLKTRDERPERPNISGLVTDTSFDLSELEGFAGAKAEAVAVESFSAQAAGVSLGEAVDESKLDEALHKIQQQQLNEQIRKLIEEATQWIEEKEYRLAIEVLDTALRIDAYSVVAFYLKGYCLYALNEVYEALAVLEQAQQLASDADALVTILMLQAYCTRAIVEEIEAQVIQLRDAGHHAAALELVETALERFPYSVALLYYRCSLLLTTGKTAQAKQAARDGIERGGEEYAELFGRLFEQATSREIQPLLEPARRALREMDAARAVKHLQGYRAQLGGQPLYEAVRSYADERAPARSGLRALFSGSKDRPEPLSGEQRQHTLQWLLAEELDNGYAAMEAEDFALAVRWFERADRIDEDCNIVNYLHALAIFRGFQQLMSDENAALDLDRSLGDMNRAAGYVRRAASDPMVSERASALKDAIESYYSQLMEIKRERDRRAEEARPVNELLQQFDSLMSHLNQNRIGSTAELNSAREKFKQIQQKARSLRKGRSKEQGGELLGQLIDIIDQHLKTLGEIEADVRKNEKYERVGMCVTLFNAMMDYYTKNPIRDRRQLTEAMQRVEFISDQIAAARSDLGSTNRYRKPYDVDDGAWDVLNQVEDALNNVKRQLGGGY